jgi:hypothetical protein
LTSAVARRKVVLIVVDGLGRAVFERAVAEGRAPTIARCSSAGRCTRRAPRRSRR